MRAISALRREAGMSTRVCLAVTALRIRVSMSAIGSVIVQLSSLNSELCSLKSGALPAALRHAGDIAFERELAEAQAAQRELPHVGARPAAQAAAVAQPNLVLRLLQFLGDLRSRCHLGPSFLVLVLPERHADE